MTLDLARLWRQALSIKQALDGLSPELGSPDALQRAARDADAQQRMLARIGLPAALFGKSGALLAAEGVDATSLPALDPARVEPTFDGGRLFLKHALREAGGDGGRLLAIVLDRSAFNEMLLTSMGAQPLTDAEFHVLANLIAGLDLAAQAERDSVSVHTRRKQMQIVTEKLGAGGQVDAVRLCLVAVADRLLLAVARDPREDEGLALLRRSYGAQMRVHDLEVDPRDPIRLIELGPRDGRPVLLFHPLLFPTLPMPSGLADVEALGLRLLVPLRRGHGLPTPAGAPTGRDEMLADFANRLDAAMGLMNLEGLTAVSAVFGAAWSSEFALRHPHRVARLVFASAPSMTEFREGSKVRSHIHAIARIVDRAPWTARTFVQMYANAVYSAERAERGYRMTFAGSPQDTSEIDVIVREGEALPIAVSTMRYAAASVANDMRVASSPWANRVAGLGQEMIFVHGAGDRLNPVESLTETLRHLPGAHLEVLPGQGHLFYLRRLELALRSI